jgi:quercetin dioxygenase-like cupin family protein
VKARAVLAATVTMAAFAACRREPSPGPVPPVTTAVPRQDLRILSGPASDAGASDAQPQAIEAGAAMPLTPNEPPVKAAFVDAPFKIEDAPCTRMLVAVVKGKVTAWNEVLSTGDVLVMLHPEAMDVKGTGVVVQAKVELPVDQCNVKARPASSKAVVRAIAAPKLEWAGGRMSANLDVGAKVSPEIYMGRLEGTAPVVEHTHPTSWEVLAGVEAAGTFTLDGKDQRLGPRQVVFVPPGARHAWKPDPGSKLVAIQMYSPPGPEQRFAALAAAERDAGAAPSASDAGKR